MLIVLEAYGFVFVKLQKMLKIDVSREFYTKNEWT